MVPTVHAPFNPFLSTRHLLCRRKARCHWCVYGLCQGSLLSQGVYSLGQPEISGGLAAGRPDLQTRTRAKVHQGISCIMAPNPDRKAKPCKHAARQECGQAPPHGSEHRHMVLELRTRYGDHGDNFFPLFAHVCSKRLRFLLLCGTCTTDILPSTGQVAPGLEHALELLQGTTSAHRAEVWENLEPTGNRCWILECL